MKRKAPTLVKPFERSTAILVYVILDTLAGRQGFKAYGADMIPPDDAVRWPTAEQWNGFYRHSDTWVRWFHANNPEWCRKLEGEDSRDWAYLWLGHWLAAFLDDPAAYLRQHSMADLLGIAVESVTPAGCLC